MLKKIVSEEFGKTITDETERVHGGDYINKIVGKLGDYIRKRESSSGPGESFVYVGEIPSIPGGFLEIIEVNRAVSAPYIEGIRVRFEYLENVPPTEDLEQVRQAINSGLGK